MSGFTELSELDLSPLFAHYPDISFDLPEDCLAEAVVTDYFSSPCSNDINHDDTPDSKQSVYTANTTPLRPSPTATDCLDFLTVESFLEHIKAADLPDVCKDGFSGLAKEMREFGSLLVPPSGCQFRYSLDTQKVLWQGRSTLSQLQESNSKIIEQIRNITYVKTRAPFTVEPAAQDIWCNYRQRAILIAEHTALPCWTEKMILEDLTHIFDSYVYHPFLQLLRRADIDVEIQDQLNQLYDALMTLLHNYNLWWEGMGTIRKHYMLPLMRRILDSPETLRENAEFEQVIEAAKTKIGSVEEPGIPTADERTILELNSSASRRHMAVPPRARNRYQREHTF